MPDSASFRSVADLWHHRIESTPDQDAYIHRRDRAWLTLTWRRAGLRARSIANGLLALGVGRGDRVALIADTRVEWVLADMGIVCAGAVTTTVFPASHDEDVVAIVNDAGPTVVFCDTEAQASRLRRLRDRLPAVRRVVVFDDVADDGWVTSLAAFEAGGDAYAATAPTAYDDARRGLAPDDLATLMYTSGTTGRPKGVMLTHDAWVYEAEAIDRLDILSPADKQYLFLPLSHVFAKVLEIVQIRLGVPTVIDGDPNALADHLPETQPTFLAAAPRTFEKAWARITHEARSGSAAQRRLFDWALAVGLEASRAQQRREPVRGLLAARRALADRLVFASIRARFGGRLRFLISGAAPLSREIAESFHAIGLLVCEGYGLTETCAATTVNTPDDFAFGTVGKPVWGTELRIAEDGEILVRSRGVTRGYWNRPDETAAAFDADGFFRTGDVGVRLASGHLQITDRKKEIIVTAGGKNIAPAQFTSRLKARCPYVSQVLVHGDRRPYCVALISIAEDTVARYAREHGLRWVDYADLAAKPEIVALIGAHIDAINQDLASFERVRRFALLPEDMTVDNGLLSPTLKVRRRAVEARYADRLDALYRSAD